MKYIYIYIYLMSRILLYFYEFYIYNVYMWNLFGMKIVVKIIFPDIQS